MLIKKGSDKKLIPFLLTAIMIISNDLVPMNNRDGNGASDRVPMWHADEAAMSSNLVYIHKYHLLVSIHRKPKRALAMELVAVEVSVLVHSDVHG